MIKHENGKLRKLQSCGLRVAFSDCVSGLLHARCYPEGSCDSGQYRDDNVYDFSPDRFVGFHDSLVFDG